MKDPSRFFCRHCGQELKIEAKIRREEVCPACGEYLHCCLNCQFFAGVLSRSCNEPQAEEVRDKEKANFCGFFLFVEGRPVSPAPDAAVRARARFRSLFPNHPERK